MKTAIRCLGLAACLTLGLFASCVPVTTSPLTGSWVVSAENAPDLKTLVLTFDSNGALQTIQYQVGPSTLITVPAPIARTSVNGSSVVITATFNNNTLSFSGNFNETATLITGNLTTLIAFGDTVVTINNGPATLTKQ